MKSAGDQNAKLRLFKVIALCGLAWGGLWFSDRAPQQQENRVNTRSKLPSIHSWESIEVSWPELYGMTLERAKDRRSKDKVEEDRGRWFVNFGGQGGLRPIDRALAERLYDEFSNVYIVEKRSVKQRESARQLGVTEAALEIKIKYLDHLSQPRILRLRIGAEHMRHSTWVRSLSEEGDPLETAWRVNRRLRRAVDHLPEKWPDRRFGLLGEGGLSLITCFQGEHDAPSHHRRHQWSIGQVDDQESWQLVTEERAPTLDQTAIRSFVYTLRTLKVSRYLNRSKVSSVWRPVHSCLWESNLGERGWVSFGQLSRKDLDPMLKVNARAGERPLHIVESSRGIGVIPDHIAHFLTPKLSQLLNRSLSMVDISAFISIDYIPPPAPLQPLNEPLTTRWRAEKSSTGWWLHSSRYGERVKSPLRRQAIDQWLSLLTKSTASVEYTSQRQSGAVTTGATITLTLAEESCPPQWSAHREEPRCVFTLVERPASSEALSSIHQWLRPKDQLSFKLSNSHHHRLVRGPLP